MNLINKIKNTKLIIILLMVASLILVGLWACGPYIESVFNPIKGNSNAIKQLPKPGNAEIIIINFKDCSNGYDVVYFGMGSTTFGFEGITNGNCVFRYGTEIENPNWDGKLDTKCKVPVSFKEVEFGVDGKSNNMMGGGIDLSAINNYCEKS